MKKQITLIVLSLLSFTSIAQDIIVKNDKTEIKAKIEELTENTIKYKKFEMLDGPSYNINKRDVFMIIYKNGTKEYIETTGSQPAVIQNQPEQENRQSTYGQNNNSVVTNKNNNSILNTSEGHGPITKVNKRWEFEGEPFTNRADFILTFEKFGYSDLIAKQKSNVSSQIGITAASGLMIIPSFFVKSFITKSIFLAGGLIMFKVGNAVAKNNEKAIVDKFNQRARQKLGFTSKLEIKPVFAFGNNGGQVGLQIGF